MAASLARALDVAPAPPLRARGAPSDGPAPRRPGGPRDGKPASPPLAGGARSDGPAPPRRAGGADDPDRAHVHGFHTYPARMHPETAMRLVRTLCNAGDTVLDPFCGSGTVLVEAMLAGCRAIGTDLNPLAVRLARVKTARFDASARRSIVTHARSIAEFADARRQRRAGASHRYPREDVALFAPHVLLELDSLAVGIRDRVADDRPVREALELVLSAVLVKVTLASSDTSFTSEPRRTASGFPARLFARKADELARRLEAFDHGIPPGVPPADVAEDDATRLRTVAASTVDAIVTSPPYAATYDYLAHHELRMRWLGRTRSARDETTPMSTRALRRRRGPKRSLSCCAQ
jgi:DNA methylase